MASMIMADMILINDAANCKILFRLGDKFCWDRQSTEPPGPYYYRLQPSKNKQRGNRVLLFNIRGFEWDLSIIMLAMTILVHFWVLYWDIMSSTRTLTSNLAQYTAA